MVKGLLACDSAGKESRLSLYSRRPDIHLNIWPAGLLPLQEEYK